mmetsp:Transcript_43943/g.116161  ORF Transcript_43943/g.116161 Transcript_43943/m.116161 type:complete len:385 (-) Transcript_43943:309-1463(-)
MLSKGTPSKPRGSEFQRTPRPIQRKSFCGSPGFDQGWLDSPHSVSEVQPPSPTSLASHPLSPVRRAPACSFTSPSTCLAWPGMTTPVRKAPQSTLVSPHSPFCAQYQRAMPPLPRSFTSLSSISTPSKISSVSTPLRPCSKQKAKEMQDDVNTAIEEQSVPLLRAALQRRHSCPLDHSVHEAVRQALIPALRMLLQSRADPNARCLCLERGCEFPLQLACSCANFVQNPDRLSVVEQLLCAGAHPNPRRTDMEANTPLHDAIRRGDFDVALMLLRHNADPNLVNGFGETPLHLVLRQEGGFVGTPVAVLHSVLEALLLRGASPLVLDERGLMPAVYASDPKLRDVLNRWSGWWRCRTLAWIHSRGQSLVSQIYPEVLTQIGRFL